MRIFDIFIGRKRKITNYYARYDVFGIIKLQQGARIDALNDKCTVNIKEEKAWHAKSNLGTCYVNL